MHRYHGSRARLDPGLFLSLLVALFAIWPLLSPGLPNTADGPIHFYRAVDMQQAWADGVFYPRWSANLALGYGTPLFNFAPPLLYTLMMVLSSIGLDLAVAMKLVIILFILISAVAMYLLGRDTLGPTAGLVATAAYLVAPYRLRELYIQGNYAQFLALSLYPLVLWCYFKVIRTGNIRFMIGGGVAYAALFLSHNISVMIFSPLLLAYVIFWVVTNRRWSAVCDVIITGALGLGLSAFFWLPAFYEQRWLQIAQITKGHFDFRLHFVTLRELFSPYVPLDYSAVNVHLPLSLGLAPLFLGAVALIAVCLIHSSVRRQRRLLVFSALLLAGTIFMMLPASTPLWEHLPLLKLTEFPWRLLGIASVPLALLAGGSVFFLQKFLSRRIGAVAAAAGVAIILIPSFFYLFPHQPFADLRGAALGDITTYELQTKAFGTTSAGEFLPKWTVQHPTDSPMVADYQAGRPADKLDRSSIPAAVKAEERGRGYLWNEYAFESSEPFTVRFNTLWYPGWETYVDGKLVSSSPSSPQGLIEFEVPEGSHVVKLMFGSITVRRLADILSLATVLVCVVTVILRGKRPVREPGGDALPPAARWTPASVVWSGGTILALLLAKECLIGPYTGWFRVQSPPGQVIGVEHPAKLALGNQAVFLGHDLEPSPVAQGDSFSVRLYWQATADTDADYRSFVHLDAPPDGTTVAQSDSMHPGGIPMTSWPVAFYAWDEHHIVIPDDLTPGVYALQAGLYNGETGQRLPVLDEARDESEDDITLQGIRIIRNPPLRIDQLPKRPTHTFEEGIQLVSYTLQEDGDGIRVTLYWQAIEPPNGDYTVFVHVLDSDAHIVAQADEQPSNGRYPTSYWSPGEIVEDAHDIALPAGHPAGLRIAAGLYAADTLVRLDVRDVQGKPLSDAEVILQ